jgi:arylsulfatase A-like enzyme
MFGFLIVLVYIVCLPGCGERSRDGVASADRPNIVLITFESLRADHVGCYGYERDTTPAIDALSAEGITFDHAYAVTSWTLTSHASILTGLYPTAHQVIGPKDRLPDSYTTLTELLNKNGYQTAGFISGPFLRTKYNLHQGFEVYDESTANPRGNKAAHSDITNPRLEAKVSRYLRALRSKTRPFFLLLYLWDPHYDYLPPDPYDKRFVPADAELVEMRNYETGKIVTKDISANKLAYVVSQYDGEVLWTDELLRVLWGVLQELGLWESTAIVLTADHGEEFFEHGAKGHKNNLHVESLHVPLIIKPAGKVTPRRDGRIVNLIDLFPTLLELARVEPGQLFHGQSLLKPVTTGPQVTFFELVTSNYFKRPTGEKYKKSDLWWAVREGDYKLISVENKDRWELYNVADDPGERHPLGSEHAGTLTRLRRRLAEHQARMTAQAAVWGRPGQAELTPEDIERLESLGYIKTTTEDEEGG